MVSLYYFLVFGFLLFLAIVVFLMVYFLVCLLARSACYLELTRVVRFICGLFYNLLFLLFIIMFKVFLIYQLCCLLGVLIGDSKLSCKGTYTFVFGFFIVSLILVAPSIPFGILSGVS